MIQRAVILGLGGVLSTSLLVRKSNCEKEFATVATYPANDPIEDRYIISRFMSIPNQKNSSTTISPHKITIVGVIDGHGGWQVSDFVSKNMLQVLEPRLLNIQQKQPSELNPMELEVGLALKESFNELEESYVEGVRKSFGYGFGSVARVGACTLIACLRGSYLSIANAGDCRAVLGTSTLGSSDNDTLSSSNTSNGGLVAIRLTHDHNAREPLEVFRLQMDHPDETLSQLVRCKNPHACYVKGRLQLTRALGDAYLKYGDYNAPPGEHKSRGRHVPSPYQPPYVSATPQVHHITLTKEDKFLVLASDGVWDFLTDQQAVDLVVQAKERGEDPSHFIVSRVLELAAEESGMTLTALKELKLGHRRNKHDDTTVVVLDL